jgi:ribonuclease HI
MLSALTLSSYGWRKQYLTTVYHSMVKSKMDYAGPAWQSNIAQTNLAKLERAQNKSLRLITGQCADTPLEALRAESGVPSFKTHIERNLLKSREKALRLEPTHPRRLAHEESREKRIGLKNNTRHSWRSKTDELSSDYHLDVLSTSRKPLVYFSLAPWEDALPAKVFASVPGLQGKSETEERRRNLSYARIWEINAEYVLYSDGSASAGVAEGAAGVVVTFGNPEDPVVIDTLTKRGSALTSSYNEEMTAMDIALDWISEHCNPGTCVEFVTDSQSLCEALQGFGQDIKELRRKLISIGADVTIHWVPGHSGIEGNERADAGQTSTHPGQGVQV